MDRILKLNQTINYIEENLTGEINDIEIEKIVACSFQQFHRMFSYMANVPLNEYIRRRKAAEAAAELQATDVKVVDIAIKYGYNSPTAFTRAFQNFHGISPSAAKESGAIFKSYPPIAFKVSIRGEAEYPII